MNDVDVLVVGGGTARTIAAIQAGPAGARTLLVEPGGHLGGMMTSGGVSYPGLFDAWGKQIISGIWRRALSPPSHFGHSCPKAVAICLDEIRALLRNHAAIVPKGD